MWSKFVGGQNVLRVNIFGDQHFLGVKMFGASKFYGFNKMLGFKNVGVSNKFDRLLLQATVYST